MLALAMVPNFAEAIALVHKALAKLHASGQDGFEGFIRDAYREATGISLRLQKTGPQGGADAVSDRAGYEVITGIEAKRYRNTTPLPLDELKRKLIDAATRVSNPLELWIVVASKEIAGDDAAELRRIGDQQGLGVVILDWRSATDPLAPLPALLALAPETVGWRLGDAAAQALDAIAAQPGFADAREELRARLMRPDLGRTYAARAVAARIEQTLRSRADARARLQNPVDMGAPARIWAPRDGHCRALDDWSRDAAETPICALIGDEGAGKTWLKFDWWRRQVAQETPPLILWLSAREVASNVLSQVLGAALAKWITVPQREPAFWARRVERWRRTRGASEGGPEIWLMLDGVNEGTAQQHVMDLLAQANDSDWKGFVGILLGDRPAHWERPFQAGKMLKPPPRVVTVSQFTDAELDDLLAKHNKSRGDFSASVLELIKWPSWFAVAAELFAQKGDWSAHSPEQLMVRYVQHRLEERGQISAVDDAMFRAFIAGLGEEVRSNSGKGKPFSRAELKERLAGQSGEDGKQILEALDDVTSGIWMKPEGLHQFSIDRMVLPFAIGLALLRQLRAATTEEEADSEVERFLGPIEDQDAGVNTLASTVSLAFIDDSTSDDVKKALLKRWLRAHNFSGSHFETLWRIGSATPNALFTVAEELWLQHASGLSVDELLIKGIANMASDGRRQDEVVGFIAKWAATYWLDPRDGQFLNYHPDEEAVEAAHRETERRLAQLRAESTDPNALAMLVRCANGAGASWLSHRVLSIASYLPRAVQATIWRGWALSRAVMGSDRHFDDLAWSVRVNPLDGAAATQALLRTVDDLLALGSPRTRTTATWLLEAHGGPEAAAKLAAIGEAFTTRRWNTYEEGVRLVGGVITITDAQTRDDRRLAFLLSSFALDPAAQISGAHRDQLVRFAASFPVQELGDGRGQTSAGVDLENADPALARWAPEALSELYRRYLATLRERDEQRLLGQMFSLDRLLILVTPALQEDMRTALIARVKRKDDGKLDQIARALLHGALFDRTAVDQHALWAVLGAPGEVPTSLEDVVRPISGALLQAIATELHPSRAPERLISWLAFLKCGSIVEMPEDWEPLWRLFNHQDGTVRYLAFELARASGDKALAVRLFESTWAPTDSRNVLENWAGSLLLCQAATSENFRAIAGRIDPQWSSSLWEKFNYDLDYSGPFQAFLAFSIERELNPPPSRMIPEYRCAPLEATRQILQQKPAEVLAFAARLFDMKRVPPFARDEWPRQVLLHALFAFAPQQAAEYWNAMRARTGPFKVTSEAFDELPFETADGDEMMALRDGFVGLARNDWVLAGIGTFVARHERAEWAVQWIRHKLAYASCSGDTARAITLAGWLDDSAAARELWTRELATAALDGWLGVVYQAAKQNIERMRRALDWLDRALGADTDEHFFACWELFLEAVDRRLIPIAARHIRVRFESLSPRRQNFISINWEMAGRKAEKQKSNHERTLFSFPIGHRWAMPWAGE